MKVVVLNNTGNVGKSFIAREVVYANLQEPKVILDFETYNLPNSVFSGVNSKQFDRRIFKEMLMEAAFSQNAVIDVGSSNIADFFEEMKRYSAELFDYDYFIVPTVIDDKQDSDTVKVLQLLAAFQLQSKTRLLFNRVNPIAHKISPTKAYRAAKELKIKCDIAMKISEHSTVNEITEARLTLNQILSDKANYKTLALKTDDKDERIALYNKHLLKVSCANLLTECRNAWEIIIGK